MCPPRPMPAAPEVSAYDALLSLVDRKQLSITFVLGLARGGTTAFEKLLHEQLEFDANVNEPSLAANGTDLEVRERAASREEVTFARVLDVVRALLAAAAAASRDLAAAPLRVIVKEVTNQLLPPIVPRYARLADCVVVVVRNPALQFESRVRSILDRVGSGALASIGLRADLPLARARVHGRALVDARGGGGRASAAAAAAAWRRTTRSVASTQSRNASTA